jgi:hypothetical protein
MKTKVQNFLVLSLILLSSYTLSIKFQTREKCEDLPKKNKFVFDSNWVLKNHGGAEITFKGTGRDVYIQLNDKLNDKKHSYWIVINGWNNKKSRVIEVMVRKSVRSRSRS